MMGGNGIYFNNFMLRAMCDMEVIFTYEGTYDINSLIAGRELTGHSAFKKWLVIYISLQNNKLIKLSLLKSN